MDVYLQLENVWSLDQSFGYVPLDDIEVTEAQCGLPGISSKSETLADIPMEGLLDLSSCPSEGSFGAEWMEQADFAFPDDTSLLSLPLSLDDDLDFKPSSTTITTNGPSPVVDSKEEWESLGHVFADEFLHSLHKESSLKLETPPSSPLSPLKQVTPEIVLDTDADQSPLQVLNGGIIEVIQSPLKLGTPDIVLDADTDHSTLRGEIVLDADTDHSTLQVLNSGNIEFIQSPLSPDDVENILSSAGSLSASPSPVPTPSPSPSSPTTVDASILYSDNGSFSLSSSELYKVVENTDKSRPTPYSRPPKASKSSKSKGRKQTASISPSPSELELEFMSKKDRKKLQNKNAAIRYRMKKKQESDERRGEVDELEAINTSLREKCDELQREVKCMKDLINDIRKARGQPPLALSQHSLIGHKK